MLKGLSTRGSARPHGLRQCKPSRLFIALTASNEELRGARPRRIKLIERSKLWRLMLKFFASPCAQSSYSIQTAIPLSVSLSLLVITSPPPDVCAVPI